MFDRRPFIFAVILISTSFTVSAQETLSVDKANLEQHLLHRVAPVYPPIAKAARIQGTVIAEIRVGVTGKIESTKVVSGPPMLQQAAIDSLKQWDFRPFEKDSAQIAATGQVSIEFSLGKDGPTPDEEKTAQRYFRSRTNAEGRCRLERIIKQPLPFARRPRISQRNLRLIDASLRRDPHLSMLLPLLLTMVT